MGLFKKKIKADALDSKDKESKKDYSKAEYNVIIVEKVGGTVVERKTIKAWRIRDNNDHVVYLQNLKEGFVEIFPEDIEDMRHYTEQEVDYLIHKNQQTLAQERRQDTEEVNDKDIEYELMKLRAKKRSFKFSKQSSYNYFDSKGQPTFIYLRKGSSFIPFKWDTDTSTVFTASENRKKNASIALRNKEEKYNTKKILDGVSIVLIIVAFIMAIGAGYTYFKVNQKYDQAFLSYDQSQIAQAQKRSLDVANQCAEVSQKVAQSALDIVNSVEDELNKNQTIIQGVRPE